MSTTMTLRIEDDVKRQLARATRRSRSLLAADAIRVYVEINEWQMEGIHAALREADAGDFADDPAVSALARRWGV